MRLLRPLRNLFNLTKITTITTKATRLYQLTNHQRYLSFDSTTRASTNGKLSSASTTSDLNNEESESIKKEKNQDMTQKGVAIKSGLLSPVNDSLITISVTFLKPDGKKVTVKAKENKSLYDVVNDNNVDIDGFGACEGTLCCTTCHLIFKQADYEKVGEPSDEELDMLDLAYGLTNTSRLGCQVFLKKELDPLEVEVPASINDIRES